MFDFSLNLYAEYTISHIYFVDPKVHGPWENYEGCIATGEIKTCGPGYQKQKRSCTDGTIDKCTSDDVEKSVSCTEAGTSLPDCPKLFGDWTNFGGCVATRTNKTCGPGNQKQRRNCTDGTADKCTQTEIEKSVSCAEAGTSLSDCPKLFGDWKNFGGCVATGTNKTCGPGYQKQRRSCSNGTIEKCTPSEMEEIISCAEAGTKLDDCPKIFGAWKNYGECAPTRINMNCGPGNQTKIRHCTDGTTDKCTPAEIEKNVTCAEAGTELDCRKWVGPWKNEQGCEALGTNKKCGPGIQKQNRTCRVAAALRNIDETASLKCTQTDKQQIISCAAA